MLLVAGDMQVNGGNGFQSPFVLERKLDRNTPGVVVIDRNIILELELVF